MTAVRLRKVSKDFTKSDGARLGVLDEVTLEVRSGEFFAMVGPSGCGKTTLLDLVIGLTEPTSGRLEIEAQRAAMVFQRPHLLPWRTVLDNALYGVECRGELGAQSRERAVELLRRMQLGDHLQQHPHQLSEGMKQRVNLARALLVDPQLLLMDEPFSALDPATRRDLQDDLLTLWTERALTIVFVSHSLAEVALLADRVAVMGAKPRGDLTVLAVDERRPRGTTADSQRVLAQWVQAVESEHFGAAKPRAL